MQQISALFIICILVSFATVRAAQIGRWNLGGKVGIVKVDSGYGMQAAVTAEYAVNAMLKWRTDLELLMRDATDLSRSDISIPSNLLYYPLQGRLFADPYAGPGLTFAYENASTFRAGANLLAGINFRVLKGNTFGFECRYTQPFLPEVKRGSWAAGLTGAWELKF